VSNKLKKKYHDEPLYPVITNGYEGEMKRNYNRMLSQMIKQIGIKMKTIKNV